MTNKPNELTILVRLRDLASKGFGRLAASAAVMRRKVVKHVGGVLKKMTLLSAGIIGATALLGRMALVRLGQLADEMDFLGKTALRLGATVQSLSDMRLVAELSGVSIQKVTKSVAVFSRNLTEARKGVVLQSEAFERLGLNVDELAKKELDITEIFIEVSRGLKNVESATERTALSMEIFGKSGADMLSILNQDEEAIRAMAAEAQHLQGTVDREVIASFERFNDAMSKVKAALKSLVFAMGGKDGLINLLALTFSDFAISIADNRRRIVEELLKISIVGGRHLVAFGKIFGIAFTFVGAKLKFLLVAFESLNTVILGADAVLQKLIGTEQEFAEAQFQAVKAAAELEKARKSLYADVTDPLKFVRQVEAVLGPLEAKLLKILEERRRALNAPDPKPIVVTASRKQLDETKKDLKKIGGFFDGMKTGFAEFIRNIGTAAEFGKQAALSVANGLTEGLTRALTDAMLGVKTLQEAFKEFAKNTLKLLLDLINRMIVLRILGAGLGIFMGGGGGEGADPGATAGGGFQPVPSGPGPSGPGTGFSHVGGNFGGGGGGGDNVTINLNLTTIDGPSGGQFLRKHGKDIALSLLDELQRNNKLKVAVGN